MGDNGAVETGEAKVAKHSGCRRSLTQKNGDAERLLDRRYGAAARHEAARQVIGSIGILAAIPLLCAGGAHSGLGKFRYRQIVADVA